MEKPSDWQHFYEKAELLKAVAHPVRLCIVRGLLEKGECNVQHMQSCLNLPQSTISQHLAKLRMNGILRCRREGVESFYQVDNEIVREMVAVLFRK
jgi:DNA-binding transcriptional ArsR family regulator